MGNPQWIGQILKRLQLIHQSRRKHHVGGKLYAIERREVLDMMPRYDVSPIENETPNNLSKWSNRSTDQGTDRFDWFSGRSHERVSHRLE